MSASALVGQFSPSSFAGADVGWVSERFGACLSSPAFTLFAGHSEQRASAAVVLGVLAVRRSENVGVIGILYLFAQRLQIHQVHVRFSALLNIQNRECDDQNGG